MLSFDSSGLILASLKMKLRKIQVIDTFISKFLLKDEETMALTFYVKSLIVELYTAMKVKKFMNKLIDDQKQRTLAMQDQYASL